MIFCFAEGAHRADRHIGEDKKRFCIADAERRKLLQVAMRVAELLQLELAVNRHFLSRWESRGHLRKSYGEPSRQLVHMLLRKLKTAGSRVPAKMFERARGGGHDLDNIYAGRGAAAAAYDVAALAPPQKNRLAMRLDQFAGDQPQNPRPPLRITHHDERAFF